jgi:hypothetical protein
MRSVGTGFSYDTTPALTQHFRGYTAGDSRGHTSSTYSHHVEVYDRSVFLLPLVHLTESSHLGILCRISCGRHSCWSRKPGRYRLCMIHYQLRALILVLTAIFVVAAYEQRHL